MNVPELSIRRPVMTTLVMIAILMVGVVGYRLLPVSDLPNVDFPAVLVTAALPGASPETMASAVATPLERQFSTISGVESMSSSSSLGATQITLTFNLSRNIDAAAQDVQAAIAKAARQLPQNLPNPPSYQKVNPADQPILYLALTSPTLPMSALNEYGETMMAQRISMVNGVAQVQVFGAQKYAVRIQLNPNELFTRSIGIDEVAEAVVKSNVELPTGILYGAHRAFTIQATGQLTTAAEYRPLIVAYRGGSPVRLGQLGRVLDSVENDKTSAWYVDPQHEQRAVILAIQRQPGTNTVEVANAVKQLLPTFREQLPGSVSLNILFDRSESIQDSVNDVQFTLLLTLALVVMVIFLFLRNAWATVIPSLTLPMSIAGTFAVMYLLGYSLDNLSLMALTLSVGFIVDDAVVMLENIVRHTEKGEGRFTAALRGSKEIVFTIVSMTLSLAAVFIPVLFMGGIVGRLFREFAVTIGVAVLVSGIISLTLTPMLASRFLRPPSSIRHGSFYRASERVFDAVLNFYRWSLAIALRRKSLTLLISLAVLVGTAYLFVALPKGFLPSEDRSQLIAFTEAIQGISFDSMLQHQREVAAIIQKNPNVEAFMSTSGSGGALTGGNTGIMFLRLKPRHERSASADEVLAQLRASLANVPGINVYLQNPSAINVSGRLSRSQYQYTLQSPDTDELFAYAGKLEQTVRTIPGLIDVNSDLEINNPQINVVIDRDRASVVGLTASQIESALANAYGSQQISTILAPNNQYRVIMEMEPKYQLDPNSLSKLYVRAMQDGKTTLVPLRAVVNLKLGVGPLVITHTGQLPSVTISFNLKPGTSLGDAVSTIENASKDRPATITSSFQGTAEAFRSSFGNMGWLLLAAVLVIYIVLGILYESFIHPLTILSALPFAGFGALLTLLVFNTELSLYAFVGIIMLVGLVKKNGIMMIDFALEAQRSEDKPPEQAIFDACIVRFRPIMMTTLAALMAGLPIAMGVGAGAEARRPLGLAVVGGLLFSQTLTLYVTPVFYLYLEALRRRAGVGRASREDVEKQEAKAAETARDQV